MKYVFLFPIWNTADSTGKSSSTSVSVTFVAVKFVRHDHDVAFTSMGILRMDPPKQDDVIYVRGAVWCALGNPGLAAG
jgi:hypothetical protein